MGCCNNAVAQLSPIPPAQTSTQLPIVAQTPITPNTQPTEPTTVGGPFAPPLNPPVVGELPSAGALSRGQWLLSPTLGVYTLYDTNIYSSATAPVRGPGLHIHPALSADYNTGLFETTLYGNIDSTIYPTLNSQNDTFNRNAGVTQRYSPLPGFDVTVRGDYTHNTNANVLISSLPAPLSVPGSPPLLGVANVLGAGQQTVVNPNDTFTAQATIYKEFNRAFVRLNGSVATTQFEQQPLQNYNAATYSGNGGFWFTPQFYAFGDGIQSFNNPETGAPQNSFRARAGIGSAQISQFSGFVYYGQQGTEVSRNGKAGGDIYGGAISYFPTAVWNMTFAVDRLRNISDITGGAGLGLGGLPFVPVGVSSGASAQITSLTYSSNYTLSPQTSVHGVVSYSLGEQLTTPTLRSDSWFADFGVTHQLLDDLTLTLDYQYTRIVSPTPNTSFDRNLITLGATYTF
jgi:hypothetical protein